MTAKGPLPKRPICPACGREMRLQSTTPDERYINLKHVIFVCDCGRSSEQVVVDKE